MRTNTDTRGNASASATTAALRNTDIRMNSNVAYGGNPPAAAPVAQHQVERDRPRRRVVDEATVVGAVAKDGRAIERTGGREVVTAPASPKLRTWQGYGEDFFYYLSGVE